MNPYTREKKIVTALTFATSLVGYYYAKHIQKDPVPIVMICGFFGAMVGETITGWFNDDQDDTPKPTV
jgi:hypothetical protein